MKLLSSRFPSVSAGRVRREACSLSLLHLRVQFDGLNWLSLVYGPEGGTSSAPACVQSEGSRLWWWQDKDLEPPEHAKVAQKLLNAGATELDSSFNLY